MVHVGEPGMRFWVLVVGLVVWLGCGHDAEAIRFELDKRECWVHEVPAEGELMHVSFVVIKVGNPWGLHSRRGAYVGVDLFIEDPSSQQVHIIKQRMQAKYNLTAVHKGLYKFCFQNRVSMLQTIDFNVHVGHLTRDEPVKDEHLSVLFAQIARVEDALLDVQFEQRWLLSQTTRQVQGMPTLAANLNCTHNYVISKLTSHFVANGLSRRVLYKAAVESLSLIACSVFQIVLLQRLFQKRLGMCPQRV